MSNTTLDALTANITLMEAPLNRAQSMYVRRNVLCQTSDSTDYEVAVFDFDSVDYLGTFTLTHGTGACSPLQFERHDANCEPCEVSDVHKKIRDCIEAEQAAIVAHYMGEHGHNGTSACEGPLCAGLPPATVTTKFNARRFS